MLWFDFVLGLTLFSFVWGMVMHDNELIKDKIEPQRMHSGDNCKSTKVHLFERRLALTRG